MTKVTMMDLTLEEPTILPEIFAKVVGGKKVLTNKFVKSATHVESIVKIIRKPKLENQVVQ